MVNMDNLPHTPSILVEGSGYIRVEMADALNRRSPSYVQIITRVLSLSSIDELEDDDIEMASLHACQVSE